MLRNTFNISDDIQILPIQELVMGGVIMASYEVRKNFGRYTMMIDRVEVPRRFTRAKITEKVKARLAARAAREDSYDE